MLKGLGMHVVKRDGRKEPVMFDKITARIKNLCSTVKLNVDPVIVAQRVVQGVFDGVTTVALDNLAAETAAYLSTNHPDYSKLAARISASNLHKMTDSSFCSLIEKMYNYIEPNTKLRAPLVSQEIYDMTQVYGKRIESEIDYSRDLEYQYFGFKTLEKSYLIRMDDVVVERPQQMLMRVSLGIHIGDIESAIETYHFMSKKFFSHATPTMYNSGTPRAQMSSCFLLMMEDDSIEGIFSTLGKCAQISKNAGGIGLSVSNIRASGSYIRSSGGYSNGLTPMLRVYDMTARYVDQGGGKRKGAFAIYIEPWHADIFDFLDLKKNHGKEEARARDLFYGLWIPDLFMKRVEDDDKWSVFCPHECPGLCETYGDEFEELYTKYERENKARRTFPAQQLWYAILDSQIETGTPYMLYKDAANKKSNQSHLGTIRCSNLCTEIIEYTSPDEIAVCNLASISLPAFVHENRFDFDQLKTITIIVTKNLNKIIDANFYPVDQAKNSNLRHRPIGIGVSGLADTFILLRHPFDSDEARQLNRDIFETIYFAALSASCDLAKIEGPYSSFNGSPASKGILQYDMWGVTPSDRWDWKTLKKSIDEFGLRNSLLVAPMPTASTAQIIGNNECIEPYTSNIYQRRVRSGEFAVVNQHLHKDLQDLGLWSNAMKNKIIAENGSIQNIDEIPTQLKQLYKTSWELKQRALIDLAADRGAFVDQSQSLNIFMSNANYSNMSSMHFYGWKRGLKTGMYYLRSQAAVDAIKFTVRNEETQSATDISDVLENEPSSECSIGCTSCGA